MEGVSLLEMASDNEQNNIAKAVCRKRRGVMGGMSPHFFQLNTAFEKLKPFIGAVWSGVIAHEKITKLLCPAAPFTLN